MRKVFAGAATVLTLGAGGTVAVDRQINPYEDRGTHLELPIKSDIPQGERVEIAKDRAEMTLKGWRDEYAIKITPQIPSATFGAEKAPDRPFISQANRPLLSKKMEFREGDVTAFIEPKEGTENEFDIDFTLHSKPDTNVFTYTIDGAEEFDFFYQPPLTQEEVDQGAERPENVVGSYAVYHKEKANHRIGSTNYATGKAFHVYRPKAIDANRVEEWCELSYESGTLSVMCDEKWLENAVYPVVVDPTFGYTVAGTSFIDAAASVGDVSRRDGRAVTLSEDGTLTSIHVALAASTGAPNIDTIVYVNREDSGGSGVHAQVASVEVSNKAYTTTKTFYTFTAASESIVADTYILNALGNGEDIASGALRYYYDDTSSGNRYSTATAGAGGYATQKTNPWNDALQSTTITHSIYATYTASGGGSSAPPDDGLIIFE